MSRYSIVFIQIFTIWLLSAVTIDAGATTKPSTGELSEDSLIMKALLADESGDVNSSRELYSKLYKMTANKAYLLQEARDALLTNSHTKDSIFNLLDWITKNPTDRDLDLYMMLVALYIQEGSMDDAQSVADEYVLPYGTSDDRIAIAALKVDWGKPKEALEIVKGEYTKSHDENILLKMVDILDVLAVVSLDDANLSSEYTQEAKEYLNEYIQQKQDASVGVYFKLIELYAKEKKLDKVLELYKQLYKLNPQKYFLQKIIEVSLYLRDIDGVVSFLESTDDNRDILFTFYKEQGRLAKAIEVAKQLYKTTQNPKWLAEQGMLKYESAKKNHTEIPKALESMQRLLERAIKLGVDDSLYLNYYGYTLIEHDLDIDRGIDLVRKALSKSPNNTYYLDSLAWGLYKKGKCKKAYNFMKIIVSKEGLKEKEIATHWDAIKHCKEKIGE